MKYLILMVKGFIIGMAKIIPGVSGAILSISFGIYERLINILSSPLKISFDDLKFLFFLFLGAGLGILSLCNIVKWLLDNFYLLTMLFFAGLIIGGLPDILCNIKGKHKLINVFIFIISFVFILMITNLSKYSLNSNNHYFMMGFIESLTTIIPGISGTAIFMALGWYEDLLSLLESILIFKAGFLISFYFILGFIVATILISKILSFLFRKYKVQTYYSILGFMFASLFSMFKDIFNSIDGFNSFFVGIILFIIGIFSTVKINAFFSKF